MGLWSQLRVSNSNLNVGTVALAEKLLLLVTPTPGNRADLCDFASAEEHDAQGAKLEQQQGW